MKKKYIAPVVEIQETEASQMMALSLQSGAADNSDVLSRDNEWDIWSDEEE